MKQICAVCRKRCGFNLESRTFRCQTCRYRLQAIVVLHNRFRARTAHRRSEQQQVLNLRGIRINGRPC